MASPPTSGSGTVLDFKISSSYTATNDFSPEPFQLLALRFSGGGLFGTHTATLNGNSLFFEGPGPAGSSAIEQNGTGLVRIFNSVIIGGDGLRIQGNLQLGSGSLIFEGPVQGTGIAKINHASSDLILRGGTGSSGLGYLLSRSGRTRIRGGGQYQLGSIGINDANNVDSSLLVSESAQVVNHGQLLIGNHTTSTGALRIADSGTTLSQMGDAFFGNSGNGEFYIENFATANFSNNVVLGFQAGSRGDFTVGFGNVVAATNAGASFAVGSSGEGNLIVLGGGRLNIGNSANNSPLENELVVGRETTGVGRVDVVFGGELESTNVVMGFSGDGRLRVEQGIVDVTDTLYLGYNAGSYGEVAVVDLTPVSANNVQIGREGTGLFAVGARGDVSVFGNSFLAPLAGGQGDLQVSGNFAKFQTDKLFAGGATDSGNFINGGQAVVDVSSGGSLIVNSDLVLYDQAIIRVDSTSSIRVGMAGGVQGAVNVNAGGKLAGTGRVEGNVVVNALGVLTPGLNALGTMQIDGNLTFAGSSNSALFAWDLADAGLATTVAGASSTTAQHDRLVVLSGDVALGNLAVILNEIGNFAASFDATQSYSWKLMEIDGTGDFTALGPFSILFNGVSGIQTAVDNQAGMLSLAIGNVGGSNQFLALNYSAVPEPSGLVLMLSSIGLGIYQRRRRRSQD